MFKTLNDFLSWAGKLVGFVDKAEKHFEANDKLPAALSEIGSLKTQLAESNSELVTTKAELAKVSGEYVTAKTNFAAELEAKEKDVDRRAGIKAIEIAAAQGHQPVAEIREANLATGNTYEELQKQLISEKDPEKRAELARKCRDARGHSNLFKS